MEHIKINFIFILDQNLINPTFKKNRS